MDETTLEVKGTIETAGQPPVEAEPDAIAKKLRRKLQIDQDDMVVFGEDGKFHLIQKKTYTAHELPDALMGTAEFLVGLGAVVADVTASDTASTWKDLTTRFACIVLNLAALRQISEKKEQPINFLHEPDGQWPREGRRFAHHLHKHHARQLSQRAHDTSPRETSSNEPHQELGPDDLVIFNEDRKFYWVKREDYVSDVSELPDEIRSAPELMVMLGVVVADIPRIPTAGTACFLLNLDSVRNGSRHAAQLLNDTIQAAKKKPDTGGSEHPQLPSEDEEQQKMERQKMVEQQLRLIEHKREALLALKDRLRKEQNGNQDAAGKTQ